MALTKDFKETIQARAQRDPAFRNALLPIVTIDGNREFDDVVLERYAAAG